MEQTQEHGLLSIFTLFIKHTYKEIYNTHICSHSYQRQLSSVHNSGMTFQMSVPWLPGPGPQAGMVVLFAVLSPLPSRLPSTVGI